MVPCSNNVAPWNTQPQNDPLLFPQPLCSLGSVTARLEQVTLELCRAGDTHMFHADGDDFRAVLIRKNHLVGTELTNKTQNLDFCYHMDRISQWLQTFSLFSRQVRGRWMDR